MDAAFGWRRHDPDPHPGPRLGPGPGPGAGAPAPSPTSAEADDTCRICRCGPEPGQPLHHPCKCTGSIRACHQECLVEWLQHSRKKYCELCGHYYVFHRKYRASMPAGRLPAHYYVRKLLSRVAFWLHWLLRLALCAVVWLVAFPLFNIFYLRRLFTGVDLFVDALEAWAPTDVLRTAHDHRTASADADAGYTAPGSSNATRHILHWGNQTALARAWAFLFTPASQPETVSGQYKRWVAQMNWSAVLASTTDNVFQGLILTAVIVVVFVSIFLLREWIVQNMPQAPILGGNPDEEEVEDEDEEVEVRAPRFDVFFPGVAAAQGEQVPAPVVGDETRQEEAEIEVDPPLRSEGEHASISAEGDASTHHPSPPQDPVPAPEAPSDAPPSPTEEPAIWMDESSWESDQPDPEDWRRLRSQRLREIMPEATSDDAAALPAAEVGTSADESFGPREVAGVASSSSHASGGADRHSEHGDERVPHIATESSASQEQPEERDESHAATADETQPLPNPIGQDFLQHVHQPLEPGAGSAVPEGMRTYLVPIRPPLNGATGMQGTQSDYANYLDAVGNILTYDGMQGMSIAQPVPEERQHRQPPAEGEGGDAPEGQPAPGHAAGDPAHGPEGGNEEGWEDMDEDEDLPPEPMGWDEEEEEADERMMEDDMDGIFEAIGLHGPIMGLVQNLAILSALCSFGIFFLGALPLFIGRFLRTGEALVAMAKVPILLLRLVTDPFFDALITGFECALNKVLGTDMSALFYTPPNALSNATTRVATGSAQSSGPASLFDLAEAQLTHYLSHAVAYLDEAHDRFRVYVLGTTILQRVTAILLGYAYYVGFLLFHLNLSKRLNWKVNRWMLQWTKSQLVVIKVGSFIGIELIVFPLGCGLLLDLATLPLQLGPAPWGTDAHSALTARYDSFWSAPITWTFLHWVAGTLYMFFFAQFVSLTRDIARPGVLCWIRDPNDPNFQPVKEILERRSVTQLAKTGLSILIYAVALFSTVAVPCLLVRYVLPLIGVGVVPIQLHYSAYASYGVELAIILTLFPWLIRKASPPRTTKRLYSRWWKFAARRLRLSSFLRGGRHLAEEGWPLDDMDEIDTVTVPLDPMSLRLARMMPPVDPLPETGLRIHFTQAEEGGPAHRSDTSIPPLGPVRSGEPLLRARTRRQERMDADTPPEGSFARVPADNNAIMSTALVIRTNARGIPLDDKGMAELRAQHAAMARQRRRGGERTQYTIVYVPPHLRLRLWIFVIYLTLSLAVGLTVAVVAPLKVGRTLVRQLYHVDGPVHDGHALFVGGCFWLGVVAGVKMVGRYLRFLAQKSGRPAPQPRPQREEPADVEGGLTGWMASKVPAWVWARLERPDVHVAWSVFTWLAQIVFKRGFVALLCGLTLQQYIEVPLRYGLRPTEPVSISLGQAWVTGLMAWRLAVFWVPDRIYDLWLGERPQYKTLAWQLSVLLVLPPAVAMALHLLGFGSRADGEAEGQRLLRQAYLIAGLHVLVYFAHLLLRAAMEHWTDAIRDEVYLESTELKDYEPEAPLPRADDAAGSPTARTRTPSRTTLRRRQRG